MKYKVGLLMNGVPYPCCLRGSSFGFPEAGILRPVVFLEHGIGTVFYSKAAAIRAAVRTVRYYGHKWKIERERFVMLPDPNGI